MKGKSIAFASVISVLLIGISIGIFSFYTLHVTAEGSASTFSNKRIVATTSNARERDAQLSAHHRAANRVSDVVSAKEVAGHNPQPENVATSTELLRTEKVSGAKAETPETPKYDNEKTFLSTTQETVVEPEIQELKPEPELVAPSNKPQEAVVTSAQPVELGESGSADELQPFSLSKITDYETALALEVHRLTNSERERRGLPPLVYDTLLADIALAHSVDMIEDEYFDHVTPHGCDILCRLEGGGYSAFAWAENIAWRQDPELPDAKTLGEYFFDNWMKSTDHRINILSDVVEREGVGVVREGDTVFITVDFSLPK